MIGKEAAGVGVAAIAGAFLLLFSSLFFTPVEEPAEGARPVVETVDPGVCLSGKCANGAPRVKAAPEFTSGYAADARNARAANPGGPRVTCFVSLRATVLGAMMTR